MSLINEALKKAQQQRAGADMPMQLGGLVRAEPSVGPSKQTILLKVVLVLACIAIILGVALSFLFFGMWQGNQLQDPPAVATSPPPSAPAAANAALPQVSTILEKSQTTEQTGADSNPIATTSAKPGPIQTAIQALASKYELNSPPPQPPPPDKTPPITQTDITAQIEQPVSDNTKLKPDPQIIAYIGDLKITAIRMAGKDSKIFINNRVYRLNSTINRQLKIKILKIDPQRIVFIDNVGIKYTKHF